MTNEYADISVSSPNSKKRKNSLLKVNSPVFHEDDFFHATSPYLSAEDHGAGGGRGSFTNVQLVLLEDGDLKVEFYLYKKLPLRNVLFLICCVLSGGLLYLVAKRWFPFLYLWFCFKRLAFTPDLKDADLVYMINSWKEYELIDIKRNKFNFSAGGLVTLKELFGCYDDESTLDFLSSSDTSFTIYSFNYRCIKFIWNPFLCMFVDNSSWKNGFPLSIQEAVIGLRGGPKDDKIDIKVIKKPISTLVGRGITSPDSPLLSSSHPPSPFDYSFRDVIKEKRIIFGVNDIEIPDPGLLAMILIGISHPFYIFQAFSIILWCFEDYYYYAATIFVISVISSTLELLESKRNLDRLRQLSHFECKIKVFRNGRWDMLSSKELVPGDIYEITDDLIEVIPCDSVLLSGDCIVNESMLTGESVPVFKTPANENDLSAMSNSTDISSKYYLFGGTKLIRVRPSALPEDIPFPSKNSIGMVVKTGFNTTKGSLIRSMMFPKPNKFQFYEDSFKFLGVLSLIAFIGFLLTLIWFIHIKMPWSIIFIRALDLITIVIPPALPAAMSIGTSFALNRLKKHGVYCISPPSINVCGKLDVIVFDKTGTLTEDGLDVLGIRESVERRTFRDRSPTRLQYGSYSGRSAISKDKYETDSEPVEGNERVFSDLLMSHSAVSDTSPRADIIVTSKNDFAPPMLYALASCHSIKILKNELVGDPMDLKMFEFTKWELEEFYETGTTVRPPKVPSIESNLLLQATQDHSRKSSGIIREETRFEIKILKTFEFYSALRRMSVICSSSEGHTIAYCKGAPETIKTICKVESIPSDFDNLLAYYAHLGYRVLGLAGRYLPTFTAAELVKTDREDIERDLHFIGFLVFENKLKRETAAVLDVLNRARINDIMCTGDNILTAVSVGRNCGLVPPDHLVYAPSFIDEDASSKTLVWRCVDNEKLILDPITLTPLNFDRTMYERARSRTDTSRSIRSPKFGYSNDYSPLKKPSAVSLDIFDPDEEEADENHYVLAVTGDVFYYLLTTSSIETLEKILVRTKIYARMAPDQKLELIERLQTIDYTTCMVGDGANDCGALKTADIGISLSEAEASVAAPFTSRSNNIECVLRIIREGRAALVTSFSCFKYMAAYSIIQFTTVGLNYTLCQTMGDFQFLFVDLFLIIPIAVFMGRTEASISIDRKRPTASLVSRKVLFSLIGQLFVMVAFQVGIYFYARLNNPNPGEHDRCLPKSTESYENSMIFLVSLFQYIWAAVVFSVGKPYRANMISNIPLMSTFGILIGLCIFFVVAPTFLIKEVLQLSDSLDFYDRVVILVCAVLNLVICYFGEQFLFPSVSRWIGRTFYTKKISQVAVGNLHLRENCFEWLMNGRWKKLKHRKRYKVVRESILDEIDD